jgi:hypothetical protein
LREEERAQGEARARLAELDRASRLQDCGDRGAYLDAATLGDLR